MNEIGADEYGGETKYIENEEVINRDINENEPETNLDTLTNVI